MIRENLLNRSKEVIRRDPWRAVMVGFALGIVFGRRSRPKMTVLKREYVDVAMNRTRTGMFAVLVALVTTFRRLFRSASHVTGGTLFSARKYTARRYSKPWIKAVRRTGRKMHLFR